ncbi:hypothetical protein, partial [Klebsiella pneumoniae]|uniref:hypothetical protein n=1 Tax=Klebsiella pneumoniae TaxID=573 RepID=UPI002181E3F6
MKKVIALALGALLLSGCTVRVADLTVASTKNYNLNGGKFYKGKRVTAEDSYPVIIFPLGIPNVKTAADRAIEKDRCAVGLSDVVVTQLKEGANKQVISSQADSLIKISRIWADF